MKSFVLRVLFVSIAVLIVASIMTACAGVPPAQQAGVIGGITIAADQFLAGLEGIINPLLPAEKQAEVSSILHSGRDMLGAIGHAGQVLATELGNAKAQLASVQAHALTPTDAAITAGALDASIEGAYRVVPALKAMATKAA